MKKIFNLFLLLIIFLSLAISPPNISENKKAYYIIQFKKEIYPEDIEYLKKFSSIKSYIGDFSYIIKTSFPYLEILKKWEKINKIEEYTPLYKIDKRFFNIKEKNNENFKIHIGIFRDEDIEEVFFKIKSKNNFIKLLSKDRNFPINRGTIKLEYKGGNLLSFIKEIALIDEIEWIEPLNTPIFQNNNSVWLLQSGDSISMATPIWNNGITGIGQIYGAADSGIDTDACQMRFDGNPYSQTLANYTYPPEVNITNPNNKILTYYVLKGAEPYDDFYSGLHGTHTTGSAVGDNYANLATIDDPGHDSQDGMAPGARIVFQDMGDKDGGVVIDYTTQTALHLQAYNSGVRIHNNSYGYEGTHLPYDLDSVQIDDFMWMFRDYTIFFAAGNNGEAGSYSLGGIGSVAKNTICVGATSNGGSNGGEDLESFSSRGPTSDGRIKPDIVVPGVVKSATDKTLSEDGKSITDPPNNNCDTDRKAVAGTSFASPTAAGAGILVRQYFTDGFYPTGLRIKENGFNPSNALIKAVLINSSRPLKGNIVDLGGTLIKRGVDPIPSFNQGWGRVTLDDTLFFEYDRRTLLVLNDVLNGEENIIPPALTSAITTGEIHLFEIPCVTQEEPLKITLNWSDPASSPSASINLVNDLDLEVEDPDGIIYKGNINFVNNFSTPAGDKEGDRINNIENVYIETPTTGSYKIKVIGKNIPGNGNDTPFKSYRQGYALIATCTLCLGDPPLVTLIYSNSHPLQDGVIIAKQGDTIKEITIEGENFVEGVTVYIKDRDDIKIEKVEFIDSTKLYIPSIFIDEEAKLGFVNLIVVNPDTQRAVLKNSIQIIQGPPLLNDINPNVVLRGETLEYITLKGKNFLNGIDVKIAGDGISFEGIELIDSKTVKLINFSVSYYTELGYKDVIVINPDNQSSSLKDKFKIVLGIPKIDSVVPNFLYQEKNIPKILITGKNFSNDLNLYLEKNGQNFLIENEQIEFINESQFFIKDLYLPLDSLTGWINLSITNSENLEGIHENIVYISMPLPKIKGIEPNFGIRGRQPFNIDILGDNFSKSCNVKFEGEGISIGNLERISEKEIKLLNVEIAKDATQGIRKLFIIQPDGNKEKIDFEVKSAFISKVYPNSGVRGETLTQVTIEGGYFINAPETKVTFSEGWIYTGVTKVITPDKIIIDKVSIDQKAPLGPYTLILTQSNKEVVKSDIPFIVKEGQEEEFKVETSGCGIINYSLNFLNLFFIFSLFFLFLIREKINL